jgi:hypothetical protein
MEIHTHRTYTQQYACVRFRVRDSYTKTPCVCATYSRRIFKCISVYMLNMYAYTSMCYICSIRIYTTYACMLCMIYALYVYIAALCRVCKQNRP